MAVDSQQPGTRTQAVASERRRFQFSLKGLLLLTAYVAVLLSIVASIVAWRTHRATALIRFRVRPNEPIHTVFEAEVKGPMFSSEVLAGAATQPEIARLSMFPRHQSRTDWLAEHIEVERVLDSELVTVSLAARDPDDAAKVVNAVVDSYFRWWTSREVTRGRRQLQTLKEKRERRAAQHERLRRDVRELALRVSTDRDSGRSLPESATGKPALDDLPERLGHAQAQRAVLEAQLAAMRLETEEKVEADVAPPPESRSPAIEAIRSELETCRTMETSLRRRWQQRIDNATGGHGKLLEWRLAGAELAHLESVCQSIAVRIDLLRTERAIPKRITLLQSAAPPNAPIPYRKIMAISALWLAALVLAAGVWRVIRQRQVKS